MNFYEVVQKRRSVRKFTPAKVPEDVIKRILNAARLAPTWANMQGVRYIVIQEPPQVEKLSEAIGQRWLTIIPMYIVVCIKESDSGKNINGIQYFTVDAAICMEHIVLAATSEGLGTCWIGAFPEEKVREALEIPQKVRVIAITPIGYPDTTPGEQKRMALRDVVFWEKFKVKRN